MTLDTLSPLGYNLNQVATADTFDLSLGNNFYTLSGQPQTVKTRRPSLFVQNFSPQQFFIASPQSLQPQTKSHSIQPQQQYRRRWDFSRGSRNGSKPPKANTRVSSRMNASTNNSLRPNLTIQQPINFYSNGGQLILHPQTSVNAPNRPTPRMGNVSYETFNLHPTAITDVRKQRVARKAGLISNIGTLNTNAHSLAAANHFHFDEPPTSP